MGEGVDLAAEAAAWLARDPDPVTRAELRDLLDRDDREGLADRFRGLVAFGTAGLRAEMGAGPNRMNRLVIRYAAAGLADVLGAGATVVVAHDCRRNSGVFAADAARVLAAAGCHVLCLDSEVPTPMLAFAVRERGADAGVMVTASHNPPGDNGFKVYLSDGIQIGPPKDAELAACMRQRAKADDVCLAEPDDPRIEVLGPAVRAAYVDTVLSLVPGSAGSADRAALSIVYTPLHGVGGALTEEVFARAGFRSFRVVAAQREPDPSFPTVPFPNPEEPGALDLALADAARNGADLVLAHDPDADRLGVAVPVAANDPAAGKSTSMRVLTGDEIGVLLAEHILRCSEGSDRLVATTFVSSRLLSRIAAHHGVRYVDTPTGFKWVMRPAVDDPSSRFVFGYEEALGYAVGDAVRDKDAITAALVFADLVATCKAAGGSVLDVLDELTRRHGAHATSNCHVRLPGPTGRERIAQAMAQLRADPPERVDGRPVVEVLDLARPGSIPSLPPTDAVMLHVEGGDRIVVRPSGTEPKVKLYVEAVRPVPAGADLDDVRATAAGAAVALREAMLSVLGLPS